MTDVAPRSTFVTAVAWIAIVLAGGMTLLSAAQNVMLAVMLAANGPFAELSPGNDVPPDAARMLVYVRIWFAVVFVASATLLVAAIAVLLRREWGRRLFVAMLVVGILWNVFAIVVQNVWISSGAFAPKMAPADVQATFATMLWIVRIASAVFAMAVSALFVWLVRRFTAADVRGEFVAPPRA